MITRSALFFFFLHLISNVTVAQFCTVPYEKLKDIPFHNMTLYVQQTGTAEGDAFLETLLTKYWTLTPNFWIVSYSEMQKMRENEKALFLEHLKKMLITVQVRNPSAGPGNPTEFSTTSRTIESNFKQDELLHVLAPPFFVKPRISNNFRVYGGHKSFLTLRRGRPSRPARIVSPIDGKSDILYEDTLDRDLVAYAPIAVQSWEAKGAAHSFRHAMLLKGLIDAIGMVHSQELEGDREKLFRRQCDEYNAGLVGYKQRKVMIPTEAFDEKLHNTFKEVFKERYVPITMKEIDQQYQTGPIDALLLLPVDGHLIVTDMRNDKVVYVDEVKGKPNKADIRRWGLEMYLASKK